ncbi:hypothetical protein JXB27_03145 [Candidatus Woesearchaeota archaeon]|nr:hypothetical protein [Candidatus Woesearchaeota archaeon]
MKNTAVFLIVMSILLVSCSDFQKEKDSSTEKETAAKEKPTDSSDWFTADMTCIDEDGDDKNIKGKAVVTYSTGQKESFNDYCPEKDEEAFKVFVVEYTCDGNKPKENLRKCDDNMTCSKGVCV